MISRCLHLAASTWCETWFWHVSKGLELSFHSENQEVSVMSIRAVHRGVRPPWWGCSGEEAKGLILQNQRLRAATSQPGHRGGKERGGCTVCLTLPQTPPCPEPREVMPRTQPVSWGGLQDAGDRAKAVAQVNQPHLPCTSWSLRRVTQWGCGPCPKGSFALQPRIWSTRCLWAPDSSLVKNKRAGEEVVKRW